MIETCQYCGHSSLEHTKSYITICCNVKGCWCKLEKTFSIEKCNGIVLGKIDYKQI